MPEASSRAGRYVQQPTGYRAYLPAPLPPDPPLRQDAELTRLLSDADRALGRLDGVASVLPNPDLFVAMYVRHEAVLNSQIEGTQSTLEDVLEFEIDPHVAGRPKDVEEVVNYVAAMNHGLRRLPKLPLSLRLLREIHGKLLTGVRGAERSPGEFRTSQNWIGPAGCALSDAIFIPPPPAEMQAALGELEKFLHDRQSGEGRVVEWLTVPEETFLARAQRLIDSPTPAAAKQLTTFHRRHRARQVELLTPRLDLEQQLATLVEDAYALTPEERTLLQETRPIRDPLDVLQAKISGKADAKEPVGTESDE